MKKLLEKAEKIYISVRKLINVISDRAIGAYSAQAAFYIFMSLIPFAAMAISIIKDVTSADNEYIESLINNLPIQIKSILIYSFMDSGRYSTVSGLFTFSTIVAVWSSSNGIFAIRNGVISSYGQKVDTGIKERIFSVLHTVIFLAMVTVSGGLAVYGDKALSVLDTFFPKLGGMSFDIGSLPTMFAMVLLICYHMMLYKFMPGGKRTFKSTLPGAVFASAGWSVITFFYSIYGEYTVESGKSIYGMLASLILVMLWLYFCMYCTLIGGLINSYIGNFDRRRIKNSKLI